MSNRKHFVGTPHSRRWQIDFGLMIFLGLWLAGCRSYGGNDRVETGIDRPGVAVGTAIDSVADAPAATSMRAPMRQSLSEFVKDPQKVFAYRLAVATMRRLSRADSWTDDFRTSLQFWANTHGYFGPGGKDFEDYAKWEKDCWKKLEKDPYNFSLKDAKDKCGEYYSAVSRQYTPDSSAEGIWGSCQHGTPNFLPWHRLYLYYYERTLRKYSESEDFALPYWNYFDYTAQNSTDGKLWLPPLVTDGGSTNKNTFFDQWRTLWLNERRVAITTDNASAKAAFTHKEFVDFSNVLEGTPHGLMHCAVGNSCLTPHMGWVPVAGSDPLFYMHHANIDRLWQCWMNRKARKAKAKVNLDWAKENLGMPDSWFEISYDFADENGNRVTRTIADAFGPEIMSVRYSEEVSCRIDSQVTTSDLDFSALEAVDDTIAGSNLVLMSGRIDLPTKLFRVDLLPEDQLLQRGRARARTLLESVGEVSSGVWLVLENITVDQHPTYTYDVYISSKGLPEKRALVTRFSFFGFGDHGGHGAHDDPEGPAQMGTQRHYLNDDIHELGITDIEDIAVYFEPSDMVTGEPLTEEGDGFMSIDSVRLITLPGSD